MPSQPTLRQAPHRAHRVRGTEGSNPSPSSGESAANPESLDQAVLISIARRGVFMATLIAFFIAEIGDKTQVATIALAAAYSSLAAVVTGNSATLAGFGVG
jgi:putative Ca2+/H+ antiporter (TMEM165/GDT1 family)